MVGTKGIALSNEQAYADPMTGGGEPLEQFGQLVENVRAYLAIQKESGLSRIAVSPNVVRELGDLTTSAPAPAPPPRPPAAPAATPPPPPLARPQAGRDGDLALKAIRQRIAGCRECPLCETRTHTVPGQGSADPELIFIGEGPGANEDAQGLAFVGRAGQLLTKMIEAMGLSRDEVWIGNIVKCRPPGNRVPYPDEMEACMPYLKEQLKVLQPKVIVCLGATAVKGLLDVRTGITKLRGTWMSFEGIDVMPTYHPAYLLRNPPGKRDVWEDLKDVLRRLGKPVPERENSQ